LKRFAASKVVDARDESGHDGQSKAVMPGEGRASTTSALKPENP